MPTQLECTICAEIKQGRGVDFPRHIDLPNRCRSHGRSVCRVCTSASLLSDLESRGLARMGCVVCNTTWPRKYVVANLDAAGRSTFEAVELRAALQQMPEYRDCLRAECRGGHVHEQAEARPVVVCETCGAKQCFRHRVPWHEGKTCDEYERDLELEEEREMQDVVAGAEDDATADQARVEIRKRREERETTRRFSRANSRIKTCPGCKARVEKMSGCDHMTCSKCHYEFCWVCLVSYVEIRRSNSQGHARTCQYYAPIGALPRAGHDPDPFVAEQQQETIRHIRAQELAGEGANDAPSQRVIGNMPPAQLSQRQNDMGPPLHPWNGEDNYMPPAFDWLADGAADGNNPRLTNGNIGHIEPNGLEFEPDFFTRARARMDDLMGSIFGNAAPASTAHSASASDNNVMRSSNGTFWTPTDSTPATNRSTLTTGENVPRQPSPYGAQSQTQPAATIDLTGDRDRRPAFEQMVDDVQVVGGRRLDARRESEGLETDGFEVMAQGHMLVDGPMQNTTVHGGLDLTGQNLQTIQYQLAQQYRNQFARARRGQPGEARRDLNVVEGMRRALRRQIDARIGQL